MWQAWGKQGKKSLVYALLYDAVVETQNPISALPAAPCSALPIETVDTAYISIYLLLSTLLQPAAHLDARELRTALKVPW